MDISKLTKAMLKLRDKDACVQMIVDELAKTSDEYARMFKLFSVTSGIKYAIIHAFGTATIAGVNNFPESTIRLVRCCLFLDHSKYFYMHNQLLLDSKLKDDSWTSKNASARLELIYATVSSHLERILNDEKIDALNLESVR